jgi:curli production assembly/transport component CsgF
MPFQMTIPLLFAAMTCVTAPAVLAGDLVYQPINPSFGGSPLMSGHLRALADMQKPQPEPIETEPENSAERFVRSLESRLMSSLAQQVSNAIFGETPQDAGTVTFGDTEVTFVRGLENISLTITDPEAGETRIEVPILQVN